MKKKFMAVSTAFVISAASVWLVLAAFDPEGNMNAYGYVAGALFWLGLLGGIVGYFLCFRKAYEGPNVLRFFSNKPASVTDAVLIISAAATAYSVWKGTGNEIVILASVSLLMLSIYFHFLLNGKIFTEILLQHKKGRETV